MCDPSLGVTFNLTYNVVTTLAVVFTCYYLWLWRPILRSPFIRNKAGVKMLSAPAKVSVDEQVDAFLLKSIYWVDGF